MPPSTKTDGHKKVDIPQGIADQAMPLVRFVYDRWVLFLVAFFLVVGGFTFDKLQNAITCAPVNPYATNDVYGSDALSCLPADKHVSWLISLPLSIGIAALLSLAVLWFTQLLRISHAHHHNDRGYPRTVHTSQHFDEVNVGLALTTLCFIVTGSILGFTISSLS